MRFAIDASDPRATNPDPVPLKEVKRARGRFNALVSGRIGSVASCKVSKASAIVMRP
jgi:hypothetical protein